MPEGKRPIGVKEIVWNERIAKEVAYAVATPIYGRLSIWSQLPLRASRSNNVWIVRGTMHSLGAGGTVRVQIDAADARVLELTHGK